MVQPATVSPAPFVPVPRFEAFDPASHHGEGPANRAIAELALALSQGADTIGPKWSAAQTLRFIALSCGGFWLAAAALYVTIH